MRAATGQPDNRVPWIDVVTAAVAAVSWALIGMAGTAALGLHLLGADTAGSLGPMTAAVVALAAGGSVTPSGDVSAYGLHGAEATGAVGITPLGVGLVGALLLSWFFLRSLRTAGATVPGAELAARAGAVLALFLAVLGGLAWAGHDVVTIDGSRLGLDRLPGTGGSGGSGGSGGLTVPGLGDVGDIGGLLPDRVGDLIDAEAAVGFTVDTAPTLLGGTVWAAGVLLVALLASRRTPLPARLRAVHRVVRPAVSALVTVLLLAVAAGWSAAGYAAFGDEHPRRIAGAALLGAPNGVWLGLPVGLLVPYDGRATGVLTRFLPDPLDELLSGSAGPVTLARLAELDARVWLLGVAAAAAMLLAGVLVAVRTPLPGAGPGAASGGAPAVRAAWDGAGAARGRGPGASRFAGVCALRLGIVTAAALPVLGWLAEVSVDASLSVLGFDAFGSGVWLRARPGTAALLGAVWGAGAGAVGGLLAWVCGAAGRRVAPLARGDGAGGPARAGTPGLPGPYAPGRPYRPPDPATNPYLRIPGALREPEDARPPGAVVRPEPGGGPPDAGGGAGGPGAGGPGPGGRYGDPADGGYGGPGRGGYGGHGGPGDGPYRRRGDGRHGQAGDGRPVQERGAPYGPGSDGRSGGAGGPSGGRGGGARGGGGAGGGEGGRGGAPGDGDARSPGPWRGVPPEDPSGDLSGAPTVISPAEPPPSRPPGRAGGAPPGKRPPTSPEEGPPPPPGPPPPGPPPPRPPRGGR